MRKINYFLLLILLPTFAVAQKTTAEQIEFEKNYQERIKKEVINDVYIPENLEDALGELSRLTDRDAILKFKNAPEDTIAFKIHLSLGRWIILNWGFYEGSRLSHHLKEKGITDPDDMARFLIVSWHRKLNGLPIKESEQIQAFHERLAAEKAEREKQRKVISVEKRIRKN